MTRHRAARTAAWLSLPAAGVLAVLAATAAAPHMGTSTKAFPMLVAGVAGGLGLLAAAVAIEPAWILSGGLALSIFSGNWSYLHVPGPLDRVVIVTGIITVLVRSFVVADAPRVQVRRVHWILGLLVVYAVGSAAWTNTLSQHQAAFELLDRLGVVPFLLYLVAPVAFATERQRTILLGTLAAVGAYLGATAFFEMIGPHSLVFPKFILDPALGIHDGRARGPFLEAGADGLAMFCCAVAAVMLLDRPRKRWIRWAVIAIAGLCLLGLVLTLTRQVWAGAAAGALLASVGSRRLRRHLPAAMIAGVVVIGGALLVIPGPAGQAAHPGQRAEAGVGSPELRRGRVAHDREQAVVGLRVGHLPPLQPPVLPRRQDLSALVGRRGPQRHPVQSAELGRGRPRALAAWV